MIWKSENVEEEEEINEMEIWLTKKLLYLSPYQTHDSWALCILDTKHKSHSRSALSSLHMVPRPSQIAPSILNGKSKSTSMPSQ